MWLQIMIFDVKVLLLPQFSKIHIINFLAEMQIFYPFQSNQNCFLTTWQKFTTSSQFFGLILISDFRITLLAENLVLKSKNHNLSGQSENDSNPFQVSLLLFGLN